MDINILFRIDLRITFKESHRINGALFTNFYMSSTDTAILLESPKTNNFDNLPRGFYGFKKEMLEKHVTFLTVLKETQWKDMEHDERLKQLSKYKFTNQKMAMG